MQPAFFSFPEHPVFAPFLSFLDPFSILTMYWSSKRIQIGMESESVYSVLDEKKVSNAPRRMQPRDPERLSRSFVLPVGRLINLLVLNEDLLAYKTIQKYSRTLVPEKVTRVTITPSSLLKIHDKKIFPERFSETESYVFNHINFRIVKIENRGKKESILSLIPVDFYGKNITSPNNKELIAICKTKAYLMYQSINLKLIHGISLYNGGPIIGSLDSYYLRFKTVPIWNVERKPEVGMMIICLDAPNGTVSRYLTRKKFVIRKIEKDGSLEIIRAKYFHDTKYLYEEGRVVVHKCPERNGVELAPYEISDLEAQTYGCLENIDIRDSRYIVYYCTSSLTMRIGDWKRDQNSY